MTITLTREEAQQVLDALEHSHAREPIWKTPIREAIETLRARLSAPEPDYRDVVIKGDLWRIEFLPDHAASVVLVRANYEAQPEPEPVAWQPIDTAPKGKIVLVHYKNRLGNCRTMRAQYYLPETLESDESESGWADEGWYEESEAYEYLMPLEGEPTHWMPLPPAPDAAPPQHKEPEPVAWMYEFGTDNADAVNEIRWYKNVHLTKPTGMVRNVVPLYTAPPQREWQGLTDEQIADAYMSGTGLVLARENNVQQHLSRYDNICFARAIEAKLKEKNNG